MNTWIERLWGSQSQQPFYPTETGSLWPRVWLQVGRWCAIYFPNQSFVTALDFSTAGHSPRAARMWMQVSGLPGKPGGELLTQEPSPMLGKYHSGQEKLQQA